MPQFIPTVHKGQVHQSSRFENETGMHVKIGKIVRVDYEMMLCDVVYLDSTGSASKLDITAGYGGYRSFLGAMPKVNDWVLIGMQKSGNFFQPYIIQFLPRGSQAALAHDILNVPQTLINNEIYKPDRYKMHKLYEGEIYGASTHGSEFLLDKSILLSNSKLNEIFLNSADQSINLTALNTYINNCGVRIKSGIIYRNNLIQDDNYDFTQEVLTYTEEGIPKFASVYSEPINATFPYGRDSLDDNTLGFLEHRIEVKELERPSLPVTESNSGVEVDNLYSEKLDGTSEKPLVVQVLGTLVGNDSVGEPEKYGVILKPKIFASQAAQKGSVSEEPCVIDEGINEVSTLAAAYTLKFPNNGTAFYVNKQGKLFLNVAASSSLDTMGGGESAEINFAGHSKIFLGKNKTAGRSISMVTDGAVFTNFGASEDGTSRSWDATFRKGVYWNITGTDKDKVSFRFDASGNVKTMIMGSRFTEVRGDDIRLIHGTLEDRVLGKKIDNFVNDKSTNYGGSYSETAVGHYSQTLSAGRSTTIYAPNILAGDTTADKTEILLGNVEHSILLGNKEESIKVGNYETNILAGTRTVDILAGSYTVKLGVGSIDIKTSAGSINVKTLAGNVEITGALGVTIKSAVSVNLEAPQVKVGGLAQGGIVNSGPAGAKCYFSGAPHLGSATATCNTI